MCLCELELVSISLFYPFACQSQQTAKTAYWKGTEIGYAIIATT